MQLLEYKNFIIDQGPFLTDPSRKVTLWVRRLDLIHPVWGGNKWFKLKVHLQMARALGFDKVITFGGAWSNHVAATARAGALMGFRTAAVIRGEPEYANNITLSRAASDGMQLHFVPRTEYRNKTTDSFLASIIGDFGNWYVIPEGGSGPEGVEGCREIIRAGDEQFDVIVVCCGTGATAAGLISSMHPHQQLLGFSVLNDGGELEKSISGWITGGMDVRPAFQINRNFVFGGYGKTTPELDLFISAFMKNTGIPTEKVYTAKMFFGIDHMIRTGYFPEGTKILALHTGGLQYMPETNN